MSHARNTDSAPLALRIWVLACALMSAAGWVLSLRVHLNRSGYAMALAGSAVIILLALWREPGRPLSLQRLRRRFRRGFPRAFLALAVLALLGGCLYPPNNFDALACRTARVLHWLDAGCWHWITTDTRGALNTRTCAFEWMTAPILLFFHSDRWLFLLNGVSFLLLPGLVFSVFRRLGLSRKVAWHWMWLLPAGLCFALQAGSLGNDIFGATLALAAIDFALRARAARRPEAPLRYAVLAAALMTGAKFSNLTLLLPWSIAVLPGLLRLARTHRREQAEGTTPLPVAVVTRWLVSLAALVLALFASFVPTAICNYRHTRDWTGMSAEDSWLRPPNSLVCFTHNVMLLTVQNLAPPVFPGAAAWDRFLQRHLSERWKATLDRFAEDGRNSYRVRELPIEEHAGLGLGLTLLVAAQLVVALLGRREEPPPTSVAYVPGRAGVSAGEAPPLETRRRGHRRSHDPSPLLEWPWETLWQAVLLISPFISLAVFMSKSAMVAVSRLISPEYALLLPLPLALSRPRRAVRSRWWHALAALAFAFAFIAVILTPARPLFPALQVFRWLEENHLSPTVERAALVYSVYHDRWDVFAPLRQVIPPSAKVLGAATGWGPETCLWRPLGQRRVLHVRGDMSLEEARHLGLEYVVVQPDGAAGLLGRPLPEWLRRMNAVELGRFSIRLLVSQPPTEFAVVRLGAVPNRE